MSCIRVNKILRMKKLIPIIILSFLFTKTIAQPHLKFIDGIDVKADAVEYGMDEPLAPRISNLSVLKGAPVVTSIKLATEACRSIQFKYAQLMDMDIEAITNFTMFGFVEDWLKTRYRYGGTTKAGIDCSAFTGLLLATVRGIKVPRTARQQYAASEKISRDEMQEGDLVFFNTTGGVSHVGVYLANDYFVHASSSEGVTISNLNEAYFSRRFIGSGRAKAAEQL